MASYQTGSGHQHHWVTVVGTAGAVISTSVLEARKGIHDVCSDLCRPGPLTTRAFTSWGDLGKKIIDLFDCRNQWEDESCHSFMSDTSRVDVVAERLKCSTWESTGGIRSRLSHKEDMQMQHLHLSVCCCPRYRQQWLDIMHFFL